MKNILFMLCCLLGDMIGEKVAKVLQTKWVFILLFPDNGRAGSV